jgi:hypothetical protein
VDCGYGVQVSLAARKPGYTLGQFTEAEYFCVDGDGKRVPSAVADRLTAAVVAASCYRASELNDAKSEAKAQPQQPARARSKVWLASAALSCVAAHACGYRSAPRGAEATPASLSQPLSR